MIKIKDLKFKYASNNEYAVDGITLDIKEGKYIAILGHNGSGKSTLAKILVGLYKPNDGEVFIDNILLSKENLPSIRSKIGMVFQNPENQFIGSTVEDDIAFGLESAQLPREVIAEKVKEFASLVKMEKYLTAQPENLSGGQKQRVAMASTLALDPKIIIFDEVTSMLDPRGKKDIIKIIKEIKKTDKTLISVTHDMDEAIVADEVIVLSGGKLLAKGTPSKILADKEIVRKAKINSPFIYKISEKLVEKKKMAKPTFHKKELLDKICK